MGKQRLREGTGLAEDHAARKWQKLALNSRCSYFPKSGALGFGTIGGLLWAGGRNKQREKSCGPGGSLGRPRGWGQGGTSGLTFQTSYLLRLNALPRPWGPPPKGWCQRDKGASLQESLARLGAAGPTGSRHPVPVLALLRFQKKVNK